MSDTKCQEMLIVLHMYLPLMTYDSGYTSPGDSEPFNFVQHIKYSVRRDVP